ncbi:MAG: hypothetical protein LBP53_00925 [Candidatus Peribacteria bacterium]|jgi:hypothetical protein|nr:hypothetical protein [Candidatus Peribacteria bacterium]
MLAYIHREMGKIQIETDNDKQYGLAFDLSNNLGIRITYHKNKKYIYKYIYKNDILKMIKIIDSYNIPKLN